MSTSNHIPNHARRVEVLTHREVAELELYGITEVDPVV